MRSATRRRHGGTSTAGGSTSRRARRTTPCARDRSDRGLPRAARKEAVRVVDRGDARRGPEGQAADVRHPTAFGGAPAAVPESPAGMAYGDNLAAVFAELPIMKAFRKRFRGRFVSTRKKQLNTMLRAFKQWGPGKRPVIAIVDWEGLPTAPEFEMFKTYFEEN